MNLLHYVIGKSIAEREGADSRFQETAGVLAGVQGLAPLSLVTLVLLARQDADSRKRVSATGVINGEVASPSPSPAPRSR